MALRQFVQAFATIGTAFVMMTGAVSADTVTFSTDAAGTGFGGTSPTLNQSAGTEATLTFFAAVNSTTGTPSYVNLGNFRLLCPACSTQDGGTGSFFDPFSFNMIVTDITDGGATGQFVGTSTGGSVYSDVSQITINWSPLQLGPGTNNALSGNFGITTFTTTVFTGIVAPNSGAVPGQSTVQGFVSSTAVPEPATLGVVGAALLALGALGRHRTRRKPVASNSNIV